MVDNMEDLEGNSDNKGSQWEKTEGQSPRSETPCKHERGNCLWKKGKEVQRDETWEEERCSGQNEAFKPGKTNQLSSQSQLLTLITPEGKRHKGIY